MNVVVKVSPWKLVLALTIVLLAIMATNVVLQRIAYERTGTVSYWVQWGWAEREPGIDYPSWRFEEWRMRFDPDLEQNIPTWYDSTLLLVGAWMMLGVAARLRQRGLPWVWQWRALAAVFVFLSLDEAAVLHEMAGGLDGPGAWLSRRLGMEEVIYFDWVLAGVAFVLMVAFLFAPLLLRMTTVSVAVVFAAVATYLAGAVVVETLAGQHARDTGFWTIEYSLLVVLEETLEGLGVIIGVAGLLLYIRHLAGHEAAAPAGAAAAASGGWESVTPGAPLGEASAEPLTSWVPPGSGRRSA